MKRPLAFFAISLVVLSTSAHADPLQSVAKRLIKGLNALKTKRVVVLPFPYHNGDISSGCSVVSERLTTLIVERGGVEVVERALLDKAMGEIKLGMTGMLDPATTQKLGKILGAGAIVTGTLIDLEERETEVNARLIQTETGSILAAATARIHRSWDDLPRPPPPVHVSSSDDDNTPVHMSKLISVSSPRRRMAPPIYTGPMQPNAEPASDSDHDVLTLTNDDLVPLNYGGRTDPEGVVNQLLTDSEPPSENAVRMARRIYHRNPDPHVRGEALLAMGHLLERSGRPTMAEEAYSQVLREFPEAPTLQTQARQRLDVIHK